MEKSHVSLEQKICKVTGMPYDTDSLLLDRRLKNSLERHTITGWGISPEVQKHLDNGFVALVEIDPEKSDKLPDGNIAPSGAYRLGRIIYMRKEVAEQMINVPIKELCFVDTETMDYFVSRIPKSE